MKQDLLIYLYGIMPNSERFQTNLEKYSKFDKNWFILNNVLDKHFQTVELVDVIR